MSKILHLNITMEVPDNIDTVEKAVDWFIAYHLDHEETRRLMNIEELEKFEKIDNPLADFIINQCWGSCMLDDYFDRMSKHEGAVVAIDGQYWDKDKAKEIADSFKDTAETMRNCYLLYLKAKEENNNEVDTKEHG